MTFEAVCATRQNNLRNIDMEPITLLLTLSLVMILSYALWFLLFADCDLSLTLKELFGCPVSDFEGKVIWITGASSGLGEAMAHELASVGARLILSARNTMRLEQVKSKCLDISQGKLKSRDVLVLPFDVTDCDIHKTKCAEALDHFQQIDVLVNNAGRFQVSPFEETDTDVIRDLFNINFFGAVSLTQVVLKHFRARRKGQIVCIASMLAKMGLPGVLSYSATKQALKIFCEVLRYEFKNDNIEVTLVCPGFFESEIQNHVMSGVRGKIQEVTNCSVQMPTSRCAHLSLVAAVNKSYEAWISYHPILICMWMCHYLPDVMLILFLKTCTKGFVSECIHGKFPKIPTWKPLRR